MTGWHEGPMLAFDTESAGVDATSTFMVTAALCRILPGEGVATRLWMLQPPAGHGIPDGARAIHGISTEHARENGLQRPVALMQIRDAIVDWLQRGHPLVAFNAAYDCTLLEHELHREGLQTVTELAGDVLPVIDPFVLDKKLSRRRGSRKLEDQCAHYGVTLDGAHDAGHDALAAARVAWRIGSAYPNLAALSLAELHSEQIHWRKEQCDSLRAYFDSKGQEHDGVDGSWPVRRTAALEAAVA